MAMNRGVLIGLIFGGLGTVVGIVVPLVMLQRMRQVSVPAAASRPLETGMDRSGPYFILATTKASQIFGMAISEAKQLHPEGNVTTFDPADLVPIRKRLQEVNARYAMVFILPEELDVNFAWAWLKLSTELDEDPFVDLRTGFITGSSPEEAHAFVKRISAAVRGETRLPARFVDNLGPNIQAPKGSFFQEPGSFMIPLYMQRTRTETLSHGPEGFTLERSKAMESCGIVHFGGHGYPDRIVDSLSAASVRNIRFGPSVIFNGACYTGVTGAWFDLAGARIARKKVDPGQSFALNVLASGPVGYLAALHPDHGIPVYQEMEYMAYSGSSLGDVIKHTQDGVVLGAGGRLPALDPLADQAPSPRQSPSDVMLKGTAARILFGDPSFGLLRPFTNSPFSFNAAVLSDGVLAIDATLRNTDLKSTYTETYFSDMSATGQFNDRALISLPLPHGITQVRTIAKLKAEADGRILQARLVGFAVERDGDAFSLQVLVDLPSTGYQQGPFRKKGARIHFEAKP